MNEIIVKLAEQAAEHAVLNPSDSVLQSEVDDRKVEIPAEFIAKFSDLILQEVIDILSGYRGKVTWLNEDVNHNHPIFEINKHFGKKNV